MCLTAASVRAEYVTKRVSLAALCEGAESVMLDRRRAWTFEPPNPKELIAISPGGTAVRSVQTLSLPSDRPGMSRFGLL